MRRLAILAAACAALPACSAREPAPLPPAPHPAQAAAPVRHELDGTLDYLRAFMLHANPESPMTGASLFRGRCSTPSAWVAAFDVMGTLTNVGDVRGTATHCSQVTQLEEGIRVTYTDGHVWLRTASGEDLFVEYGNGRGWMIDAENLAYEDDWMIVGGTGGFADVRGEGVDRGIANVQTNEFTPLSMRGFTVGGGAGRRPDIRGTLTTELRAPYAAAGRMDEDPCVLVPGPGWATVTMTGHGRATLLGTFTTDGAACINLATGESSQRRLRGVTTRGDLFELDVVEMLVDLPWFVPGLDRTYSLRFEEHLAGGTGRLQGVRAEIWSVGQIDARWEQAGGPPVPRFPWVLRSDLTGWLEPST
ncbi:MAG TPA: hypothetical protein VK936_00065 [Longimicrobiales bacterium]|nr:hypothetical protein [Longimicrobiales bacterium]